MFSALGRRQDALFGPIILWCRGRQATSKSVPDFAGMRMVRPQHLLGDRQHPLMQRLAVRGRIKAGALVGIPVPAIVEPATTAPQGPVGLTTVTNE